MKRNTDESSSQSTDYPGAAISLRLKLSLFAAALVIVPGLLFAIMVQQSGQASLQNMIGRQLAREAAHTRDRLTTILRREKETLRSFAQQDLMREIRVGDIDKRISAALTTLRDGNPVRVDYLVLDRTSQVVASSSPRLIGPRPAWLDDSDGSWSEVLKFADPITAQSLGAPGVFLVAPVADPDARLEPIGVLVGVYEWEGLTGVIRDVKTDLADQDIRADVVIARDDGSVIAGIAEDQLQESLAKVEWDRVGAVGLDESEFYVLPGSEFLVGRAALGPEFSGWQLLIVEPFSDAFAPVHQLTRRLGVILALTLAVALGLAAVAGRRTVRPLSELTTAVRSVSLSGLSKFRVQVRSEDEVGTLATAFNRMASELDQAQRALVEAAKFALVGELAAGIAHELRTSLGVLRSSVQIVERTLPEDGDHEIVELAQLIRAEVDRLGGIVNELLELGRPRSQRLERVSIASPLLRALELVHAQASAGGIELIWGSLDEKYEVLCDVEMIHQVALNLLVNAIQALESGDRIEVSLIEAEDGFVGFEVKDDGPGMEPDFVETIFRPFASGRKGGIGLGLTFVQRVVYEHHGRVTVDSEVGSGTSFRVELPAAEANA